MESEIASRNKKWVLLHFKLFFPLKKTRVHSFIILEIISLNVFSIQISL